MPHPRCDVCHKQVKPPHRLHQCSVGSEMRCDYDRLHNVHSPTCTSFTSSTSSTSCTSAIFDKSSEHHRISLPQRYSIITLHLLNYDDESIASIVNCNIKSVRRWISHFTCVGEFTEDTVAEFAREGRPRVTDSCLDDDISDFAVATKLITPSQIKHLLDLSISSR